MNYINIGVAVILFGIGFFIKVKKVTWLISGYNTAPAEEKEKYDINKLCHHTGNFVYLLAFMWAIMTILYAIFKEQTTTIMITSAIIFTIVIVIGVVWLNTGGRVKKGWIKL